MAITIKDLPYPKTGDRPSHSDITRLSDALTLLARQVGGGSLENTGSQRGPWVAIEQFVGIVSDDDAPAGMYYVDRAVFGADFDPSGLADSVPDAMFPGRVLATNWAELTPATSPAAAIQGPPITGGQQVQVTRWMSRASLMEEGGRPKVNGAKYVYTFYFTPSAGIFVVNLVKLGGADGTNAVYPTWTYNAFERLGNGASGDLLGGPLTPIKPRFIKCSVIPATVGAAFFSVTSGPVLYEACEVANQTNCT